MAFGMTSICIYEDGLFSLNFVFHIIILCTLWFHFSLRLQYMALNIVSAMVFYFLSKGVSICLYSTITKGQLVNQFVHKLECWLEIYFV